MTSENPKPADKANGLAQPVVLCLLLAAVTAAVYWPVTRCDFLNYDDPDYFTSNPHVLAGLTPGGVRWAFTTGHAGNWHPLTWLSLMLDAGLSGPGPTGPHVTNLIFHLANTVLVFLLLQSMTRAMWRSVFVAALFALHPLHVESVAWVAERKDVLSTFFGLLSLWAYARYAQGTGNREPGGKTSNAQWWYWLALLFFALGLMSKPMLVTLPFVMLLLDYWPLRRVTGTGSLGLVMEKWPFFLSSVVSGWVTFLMQQKGGAVAALVRIPMAGRVENSVVSYARYLGKTIWPAPLANPYPYPEHWAAGLVAVSAALVIGLSVAAAGLGRKLPFVPVGWFWFVGTLIPVIGLVQVGDQSMADRYTYLPLIGIFMIAAWGLAAMCANGRRSQPVAGILAVIFLTAFGLRTRDQIGFWQNSGTLFRHTLAVTENNFAACNNLGTWLSKNGRVTEAMEWFRRSLQILPDNPHALYNLGNAFARLEDWDEAIVNYRRALQVSPDQADILNNLGFALAGRNQFAEAIACFEAALKVNPDSASTHYNLAGVLFWEHHLEEAIQQYREALRITPEDPQIYVNLGDVLVMQGRTAEAVKSYQEALRLKPGDPKIEAKLQALGAPVAVEKPLPPR
jgi:tetratricopeptide (TPR) repeat protein